MVGERFGAKSTRSMVHSQVLSERFQHLTLLAVATSLQYPRYWIFSEMKKLIAINVPKKNDCPKVTARLLLRFLSLTSARFFPEDSRSSDENSIVAIDGIYTFGNIRLRLVSRRMKPVLRHKSDTETKDDIRSVNSKTFTNCCIQTSSETVFASTSQPSQNQKKRFFKNDCRVQRCFP
jgi:hypothetical protein